MENNQEKKINKKEDKEKRMMQDWQVDKLSKKVEAALKRNEFNLTEGDANDIINTLYKKELQFIKKMISQDPAEALKKNSKIKN